MFDVDGTNRLGKEHFNKCAEVLGYDSSESTWEALEKRFGLVKPEAPTLTEEEALWKRIGTPPPPPKILDLGLVGDHFINKYDAVLEEIFRRLLGGILSLAERTKAAEEAIYNIVHREEIERERKMEMIIRRLRNGLLVSAFDGWVKVAKAQRAR